MTFVGGMFSYEKGEGDPCDWWLYEDLQIPQTRLSAAVGFDREEVKVTPITYDEMRPGCYDPKGAPRGHGRQLGRGVALVPDVPALLRPDVPRSQGQGARRPLRQGVQRLDVRRVVRGLRTVA